VLALVRDESEARMVRVSSRQAAGWTSACGTRCRCRRSIRSALDGAPDVAESRAVRFGIASLYPEILPAAAFLSELLASSCRCVARYEHSAFFEQNAVLPPASAERFAMRRWSCTADLARADVQSACGVLP
jgi:hypothetical protein